MQIQLEMQNKLLLRNQALHNAYDCTLWPHLPVQGCEAASGQRVQSLLYAAFTRTGLRSSKRPEVAVAVVRRMSGKISGGYRR